MNDLYQKILQALQKEDKEQAVSLSLGALERQEISVSDLYEGILTPALVSVVVEYKNEDDLIWREHVRSGIVRTIIECAYPYIVEEKKTRTPVNEKVLVMCPEYEDHEIGAKMVADFYDLVGYDAFFTGARTPAATAHQAIREVQPKYLVISVTNFYNFISIKRLVDSLREEAGEALTIIVGGRAVQANPDVQTFIGADLQIQSFKEIEQLSQEDVTNEFSL